MSDPGVSSNTDSQRALISYPPKEKTHTSDGREMLENLARFIAGGSPFQSSGEEQAKHVLMRTFDAVYGDGKDLQAMGRRALALLVAMEQYHVGGKSARQVAREYKLSSATFARDVAKMRKAAKL